MATVQIKSADSDNQALVDTTGHLYVSDGGTPLQVTGTFTAGSPGFTTITPGYPTQISVGNSNTVLFPANPNRVYCHIMNNSSATIYIQYQVSAALNQGIKLNPGSLFILDTSNLYLGVINAIGLMANQLIDVLEGE